MMVVLCVPSPSPPMGTTQAWPSPPLPLVRGDETGVLVAAVVVGPRYHEKVAPPLPAPSSTLLACLCSSRRFSIAFTSTAHTSVCHPDCHTFHSPGTPDLTVPHGSTKATLLRFQKYCSKHHYWSKVNYLSAKWIKTFNSGSKVQIVCLKIYTNSNVTWSLIFSSCCSSKNGNCV